MTKDTSMTISQAKWDMRDVSQFLGRKDTEKLIKFYVLFAEKPTLQDFFYNYTSYYDKMLETKEHLKARRALVEKTLKHEL